MLNIKSNIHGIDRIAHSREPVKLKEVTKRVKELEKLCSHGFTPQNENIREKAIESLQALKKCKLSTDTIVLVSETILSIQKAPSLQGPLKLAIYIDIDSPDHNSAIASSQKAALECEVPFITTRAILTGSKTFVSTDIGIRDKLVEYNDQWEIYAHGEFLVFLPKSLLPDMPESEKLKALDFAYDGTLKKITANDALQSPTNKSDYQTLIEIFSPTPSLDKVIFISGHGGLDTVAALEEEKFLKFLQFLKMQKCAALTVNSCYSGGSTSELFLDVNFPVIVRSVGDFPTLSGQEAEKDLKLYLDEVSSFLGQSPTIAQFKKMLIKVEQNKEKAPENLAKIYFPHSSGFRPVGEGGTGYSLTYAELMKKTIENPEGISLQGIKFLEIHPLIIELPLIFENPSTILLSMIPSDSHHFIKTIDLKHGSPLDLIKKTTTFHKEKDLLVNKAFFISKIKSKGTSLKDVVLFLQPLNNLCLFRDENDYYYMKDDTPVKITPFQYALQVDLIEKKTRASEKMVRASTGGHQDEKDFYEHFSKWNYSSEHWPLVSAMNTQEKESFIFYLLANENYDHALQIFAKENLSPDIKNLSGTSLLDEVIKSGNQKFLDLLLKRGVNVNGQSTLKLAIETGNDETIEKILNHPNFDINLLDYNALRAAFENNKVFDQLMAKGASVDKPNNELHTLLGRAAYFNIPERVDRLLAAGADPNGGNPSALYMAVLSGNINIVRKLLEKGGKNFGSPSIRALRTSTPEIVELFLQQPILLDKSLMKIAFESLNIEKVKLLFEKGLPLPEITKTERFTIESCLKKYYKLGQWDAVEELLERTSKREYYELASEALMAVNPTKVAEYLQKGLIDSDRPLNRANSELLEIFLPNVNKPLSPELIEKIIQMGKLSLIKILEEKGINLTPLFNLAVQTDKIEIVKHFIDLGAEVNPKNDYLPLEYAANNGNLEIMKLLLEHGADLNRHGRSRRATPFAIITSKGDMNLVNWALENGAEVNPKDPQGETPLEAAEGNGEIVKRLLLEGAQWTNKAAARVVGKGDIRLIKYCLKRGANIATEESYLAAILSGKLEVLALVQREGADIKEETLKSNFTNLLYNGHHEMFLEVIEMMSNISIEESEKENLWSFIIGQGNMKMFLAFLKIETDLSIPYKYAIEKGNLPMVLELEKRGYPKDFELPDYKLLLESEHIEVLEHLFELGLDVDKIVDGESFFQIAMFFEVKKVIKLLLDLGVNPNQDIKRGSQTYSALDWSIQRNKPELVRMLLKAGANITEESMTLALSQGNHKILKLLQQ